MIYCPDHDLIAMRLRRIEYVVWTVAGAQAVIMLLLATAIAV